MNQGPRAPRRLSDDAGAFLRSTGVKVVIAQVATLLAIWIFQRSFGG